MMDLKCGELDRALFIPINSQNYQELADESCYPAEGSACVAAGSSFVPTFWYVETIICITVYGSSRDA